MKQNRLLKTVLPILLLGMSFTASALSFSVGDLNYTTVSDTYAQTTKTYTVNGVSFKMVFVEGGTFTMGATEEQGTSGPEEDEYPTHQVMLSDFAIGQTEVTQALWVAVMGSNPSRFTGNLQRPVESVSWNDCQTFITKLNLLTGEKFRLPTEAEWEYAARGGNKSNGFAGVLQRKLRSGGIDHLIDHVVLSDDCGITKPLPGIFDYAQKVSGATVDQIVMIGDDPDTDIAGAYAAGWRTIYFNFKNRPAIEGTVTVEVASLAEIEEML